MVQALTTRFALGNKLDLVTPTSAQEYKLGMIVEIATSSPQVTKYIYVRSHGALTQYVPYVLDFGSTSATEIVTAAPATLAAPGRQVVIPQVGFTTTYYGFVLLEGEGKAIMTAETYEDGDHLQLLTTGTELNVDGTSGSTVFTVNTCAICGETDSDAVARDIHLINRQAVVAGT